MKNKFALTIFVSIALMLGAFCIQVSKGAYDMDLKTIYNALTDKSLFKDTTYFQHKFLGKTLCEKLNIEKPILTEIPNETLIMWNIRIPRFLIGICVGINLAVAGCIFQTITKNEMSSAYTLGISQGSGLSMLLIVIMFPSLYSAMPVLSMIGGIVAFFLIYFLSWKNGTTPTRLVLSGMIVGTISIAIQKGLYYFIQDIGVFQDVLSWTTGSLIGLSWQHFMLIFPWTIVILLICLTLYRPLNVMLLGDTNAKALGVSVEKWKIFFALVGILAASSAVCVAGLIGFVGLIAPHIGRSLAGYEHQKLFISCSFIGASLLTVSDTISRILLATGQIPVGIILNTIGGIFFIILMKKSNSSILNK